MNNLKITTTKDFENYINKKIEGLNFQAKKEKNIELEQTQIEMLCNLFQSKAGKWSYEYINVFLNDIMKKPNLQNGKVYEALAYSWLESHGISFETQVKVLKQNCLKRNDYDADGLIDNTIYFDVKQFGITLPHLDTLRKRLQELVPENYFVTVGGTKNISTKVLEDAYLSRLTEVVQEVMSEKNRSFDGYTYHDNKNGIEITLYDRKNTHIFTSISEFDQYEWAENNQFYFMYHASQFCVNSPYIIICPFDHSSTHLFSSEKMRDVYDMLRPLCRRMFMNLINIKDRDVCEFDTNAKEGIKIATAARKISAIVFLDVSREYKYENARIWAFINPNADHKLLDYQIHELFRLHGSFVEDFRYDNY